MKIIISLSYQPGFIGASNLIMIIGNCITYLFRYGGLAEDHLRTVIYIMNAPGTGHLFVSSTTQSVVADNHANIDMLF